MKSFHYLSQSVCVTIWRYAKAQLFDENVIFTKKNRLFSIMIKQPSEPSLVKN